MDSKKDEMEAKNIRGIKVVMICSWITAAALLVFALFGLNGRR
jgi:hypothetical protein